MNLYTFPFSSDSLSFIIFEAFIRLIYIYNCYMFRIFGWSFYHYEVAIFFNVVLLVLSLILSDINIVTPLFLTYCSLPCISFPILLFLILFVSIHLKCMYYKQYKICPCFLFFYPVWQHLPEIIMNMVYLGLPTC